MKKKGAVEARLTVWGSGTWCSGRFFWVWIHTRVWGFCKCKQWHHNWQKKHSLTSSYFLSCREHLHLPDVFLQCLSLNCSPHCFHSLFHAFLAEQTYSYKMLMSCLLNGCLVAHMSKSHCLLGCWIEQVRKKHLKKEIHLWLLVRSKSLPFCLQVLVPALPIRKGVSLLPDILHSVLLLWDQTRATSEPQHMNECPFSLWYLYKTI